MLPTNRLSQLQECEGEKKAIKESQLALRHTWSCCLPRIQIEEQKLFYQGSSIQEEHAQARSGNTSDTWGKERGNQVQAHKGIFFLC